MIPCKLKKGDEVRIIAPSLSGSILSAENYRLAESQLNQMGLMVSFGEHIQECDLFNSSSVRNRIQDFHAAFLDPKIKAIFTIIGGYNANQLLDYIDFDIIQENPKIFCGYSDITILHNAIYAKTSLVTYLGPHFSTFAMQEGSEFTNEYVSRCLFKEGHFTVMASAEWSDDPWYSNPERRNFIKNKGYRVLNPGNAVGILVGGNLCTFSLLAGTTYMPNLKNSVLLLEDDDWPGKVTAEEFDRNLQALIQQPEFYGVQALLIGRFQRKSEMTAEKLDKIISSKVELKNIPVISELDFGHTHPMMTLPIGGFIRIKATASQSKIVIEQH